MNIHDVETPTTRPEDLLGEIRRHQVEHLNKYLTIEGASGLGLGLLVCTQSLPLDLHDRTHQYLVKDYCWRVTEEFTEATDALPDRDHYLEELIDGLHFLTELMLLVGWWPEGSLEAHFAASPIGTDEEAPTPEGPFHQYRVIERLGCACNTLKNKPWKATQMLTDMGRFRRHMEEAWFAFIDMMKAEGLEAGDMFDLYFRKSTVNQFRQRSKY